MERGAENPFCGVVGEREVTLQCRNRAEGNRSSFLHKVGMPLKMGSIYPSGRFLDREVADD